MREFFAFLLLFGLPIGMILGAVFFFASLLARGRAKKVCTVLSSLSILLMALFGAGVYLAVAFGGV